MFSSCFVLEAIKFTITLHPKPHTHRQYKLHRQTILHIYNPNSTYHTYNVFCYLEKQCIVNILTFMELNNRKSLISKIEK